MQQQWACVTCGFEPLDRCGILSFAQPEDTEEATFDANEFETLAAAEQGHFWFEARNYLIVRLLRKHFPDAQKYLEVGCGTGYQLAAIGQAFPSWDTSGSDLFIEGLRTAQTRCPGTALHQIDAAHVPFRDEFDVIGIYDVLEHIEDDQTILAELHRALRPGSGLLLTVPQHPWLWSSHDERAHHKRRYRRQELERKLEQAGFEPILISSFVLSLLPAMALSRWLSRWQTAGAHLNREYGTGRFANRLLYTLLRTEARLVVQGVPLPLGGSLVAVARRD